MEAKFDFSRIKLNRLIVFATCSLLFYLFYFFLYLKQGWVHRNLRDLLKQQFGLGDRTGTVPLSKKLGSWKKLGAEKSI